jgi:glycosyltransferase involved in cell wall biosynthesis
MLIVHLMASPFYGGPERQMLGLAVGLAPDCRSVFLSFAEGGRCESFLDQARRHDFDAIALSHNYPGVGKSVQEIAGYLRRFDADVLCCSGYKPDVIGWLAARRAGVPVVAVAHGWTAATLKVRLNEALDRMVMRRMDATVCVSKAQAVKVRRAGVAAEKVVVIRNAIGPEAFADPDPAYYAALRSFFPVPPRQIVAAAGRLSREKGFDQLVEAATLVSHTDPTVGFVVFGDGPMREVLERQIVAGGLEGRFVLAGFRADVCRFLPHAHLAVIPSFTEGLPVILLEAYAAAVPVVATAVGGTPEVIEDGANGYLVPPGNPSVLAARIIDVLADDGRRQAMGMRGSQRVAAEFTVERQSEQYRRLFERLSQKRRTCGELQFQAQGQE